MKKILLSVHPKWCKMIFNGKKTIEVRRTRPKLEPPFEVYFYQTKFKDGRGKMKDILNDMRNFVYGGGKVIGSFICDDVITDFRGEHSDEFAKYALLSLDEQKKYGGNKPLYGWHITSPKLFDKPKELSEFYIPCKWYEKGKGCPEDCALFDYEGAIDDTDDFCLGKRPIIRPPQSFCYIEEY